MLLSYLKTASRSLLHHPVFSVINVTGLAVGMACSLLILLFVRHELSYEDFNDDADRVYRLVRGRELYHPAPLGPVISDTFHEIEAVARTSVIVRPLIARGENKVHRKVVLGEPALFDVLDIPFVRGDRATALDGPYRIVLSKEVARAYFGDSDPVGQTLRYDSGEDYEVTGIYELPANSHFPFEVVVSYSSIWSDKRWGPVDREDWWGAGTSVYIYLKMHSTDPIPDFAERLLNAVAEYHEWMPGEWRAEDSIPGLQPVADIHLYSHLPNEVDVNSKASYVSLLAAIGAFVLFIACLNFVSLSTAQATERVKEIGMRKVVGARRAQLVAQFLCESGLQVLLAAILALCIALLMIPGFAAFVGRDLSGLGSSADAFWILSGLASIAVIGAGYPSAVLANLEATRVFREWSKTGSLGGRLRRRLVEFQFALSILLVLATSVVVDQYRYLQSADVGFEKDDTIWLRMGHPGVSNAPIC